MRLPPIDSSIPYALLPNSFWLSSCADQPVIASSLPQQMVSSGQRLRVAERRACISSMSVEIDPALLYEPSSCALGCCQLEDHQCIQQPRCFFHLRERYFLAQRV